ncbi:DNA-binding pseudobarrel domain superfamily [Arabidopsis thaliana x Arabidopsis arenosa]|uniref:B3 domain-containing protein REM1 n=1 Tax=Arabidopsis thaliana x Arabidopsis arenosa TaxID=1240361 RepID=A0A8T1Y326_9BRAS|nr:DNA-binding pseudobarrel domain superfamily [Arabidopsis thaliana x Arabidopsis arenosa]
MEDPPHFSLFQHKFQTGDKPLLTLDADFLMNHTKVLLKSDASDRLRKVKLDGGRLSDGWEEFAGDHKFRDGDVLVFKHHGDEVFHVSVSGDIQKASSSHVDTEDTYIDDEDVDVDDDDYEEDEDDDEGEDNLDCCDSENISEKRNKKQEADSSSDHSGFITACVTRYSLLHDRLDLSRNFTLLFGGNQKTCEIDVVNEQGRRWTMKLAKNISSGVFYIRQGWGNFCCVNGLSQGELCKFKLFQNGERPVLWLCPQESGNGRKEKRTFDEVSKVKEKKTRSPFLIVKYTPSRDTTGQLSLPVSFTRKNNINKAGEVILLNQDGRKWSSYLQITGLGRGGSEWFYLRRGWREMCEANGVKVNDSFKLELMWEGANPMFKFCSKIEDHEYKGKGNQKTRKKRACETDPQPRNVKKTPRVGVEGPEHQDDEERGRTQVSNRTNTISRELQRLLPRSCSVSDQVANVKQGIVDTLNTVRQCRTELETSEQNLQASLLAIDALGERIWGISKILSNNLV